MGSLMAGWCSIDPKSATLKRNRSLTKDEIDAYWRSKKKVEEEHLRAISNLSQTIQTEQASKKKEPEMKVQRSISMPLARVKESLHMDVDKNGWWTKSSWAFLNEPPVNEAASNKYASQFTVANLGSLKLNPEDGISSA